MFLCVTVISNAQRIEMFSYDPTPAEVIDYPFIDSTVMRVRYKTLVVNDVTKPNDKNEEVMSLQIGKNVSKYSNFHWFLSDSLHNALARKKTPTSEVLNKVIPMMAKTTPLRVFKNYTEGKMTIIDRVPFDTYKYEEEMTIPVWRLKQDTLTVCGHLCKKATTTLFGRDYTVWYSPEIPISDGPWKFFGLPGLILKADDLRGEYSFECIAIEKNSWGDIIYNTASEPIKIDKKKFYELKKQYKSNPSAFVNASSMIQGELPASASKSRPYNPIELSVK